jgi:integrase
MIDEATVEARRRIGHRTGSTVILFGSYARVETDLRSDLDLPVTEHEAENAAMESVRLRRTLRGPGIPADIQKARGDLRHAYGTRTASTGVSMRALQALMGHPSIETTEIYADYAPDPDREAAGAAPAFPDQ